MTYQTNPNSGDTDSDTLPDLWEVVFGLNPKSSAGNQGASGDPDGDLLLNSVEHAYGLDPLKTDTDNDGLSDYAEVTIHHTYGANPDSDYDGLSDGAEMNTNHTDPLVADSDDDGLFDGEEVNFYLSNPNNPDSDGDLMIDGWEVENGFNLVSAADALLDADGDGINNLGEFHLRFEGKDPNVADAAGYDWNGDTDHDGLSNQQEINVQYTDPTQPDTDGDTMDDGWEAQYTFNPRINNNTDSVNGNNLGDDPDSDGLINSDECQEGTNPLNADTDGDGVSAPVEIDQASDAKNAASTQPASDGTITVQLSLGDQSGSHSERYKVVLTALEGDPTPTRSRSNSDYGIVETKTFKLPKGAKYKVEIMHTGTDPKYKETPRPDYDYTLEFTQLNPTPAAVAIFEDPEGILGEHWESDELFAEGKSATLYVVYLTSETAVALPTNRQRTKVGVFEKVDVQTSPLSAPTPTSWAPVGDFGTSTVIPYPNANIVKFTAGYKSCSPIVRAVIDGKTLELGFTVAQPSIVNMVAITPNSNTASPLQISMQADVYIGPEDVSFVGLTVFEGNCFAAASGYFLPWNNFLHTPGQPMTVTSTLVSGKGWKGGLPDNLGSPAFNPTYSTGDFKWVIPWRYSFGSSAPELIKNVDQIATMRISPDNGKATLEMSKAGAKSDITEP